MLPEQLKEFFEIVNILEKTNRPYEKSIFKLRSSIKFLLNFLALYVIKFLLLIFLINSLDLRI